MAQLGNKPNSYLNREWGKHVKKFGKRQTAKKRRRHERNLIRVETDNNYRFRNRGR